MPVRTAPRRTGAVVLVALLSVAGCSGSVANSDMPGSPTAATGHPASPTTAGATTASAPPTARSATSAGMPALPPTAGRFSYQIGGPYPPGPGVAIVTRDRTVDPAPGVYSVCYLNAFQAQERDIGWWKQTHPDLLLSRPDGSLVVDTQWGEPLFDLRTDDARQRLAVIVGGWIDECAAKGYQAVEADNLDSYTRSESAFDWNQALALGQLLAHRAERAGMPLAQKNAAELSSDAQRAGFDFAVAEECGVRDECGDYVAVYGSGVLDVEYTDQPESAFVSACAQVGRQILVTRRDRAVTPRGQPGYVETWCP